MDENVDTTCALYVKPESARRRTAQMNAGERGKGCNSQRRRPPLRDQMPLAGARLAAIARTAHTQTHPLRANNCYAGRRHRLSKARVSGAK